MKMDITKRRKMMALFLAGILTVSADVTGCGRKNVDYNVDNTEQKQTEADQGQTETSASGEDLDSGSLWSKYKIPFTCDTEIAIGDTGLSKIHVTDDDISVPDTSDLQIAQYKKKDPESNEVKKQVAENLFDKDEGITDHSGTILLYSFLVCIFQIGCNLAICNLDDPICHLCYIQVVCNNDNGCLISIIHFLNSPQYILR